MIEPNREIDELIAEYVFGYRLEYEFAETYGAPCVPELRDQYDEWGVLPHYSSDMADAWSIVERLRSREPAVWLYELAGRWETLYRAVFETREDERGLVFYQELDESAPRALCLAALKAVGRPVS